MTMYSVGTAAAVTPHKGRAEKKAAAMNNGATNPAASLSVLHINLKHCRLAQDLFVQNVARMGVHIAVVSEPYAVGEAKG